MRKINKTVMTKYFIGSMLKFIIRRLRFLNKVMQNISIIKPIFTFLKNNKTLAKIIN
jgi:hypothetical protein